MGGPVLGLYRFEQVLALAIGAFIPRVDGVDLVSKEIVFEYSPSTLHALEVDLKNPTG